MNMGRRVIYLVVSLTLVFLGGCSQNNDLASLEENNVATIRYVHSEMAKGNMDVFDKTLAPNYVRHCQAMPPDLQEMYGSEPLKAFVSDFISAVSDFSETIDVIVADSDKVAYVTTMKGTQTGVMGELPASGKTFTCVNIIVHRFEDGKIAESWVSWDNVAMLSQLGFFPPPSQNGQP
ncbi:MAG: ester cyclase [Candidatus Zixiibacteriota bacterium]